MPIFVVERYWPGVSDAEVSALADRLRHAIGEDGPVRYLGSVLLVGDDVVQCRFDAPAADAVRQANEAADAAFDRILLARPYSP